MASGFYKRLKAKAEAFSASGKLPAGWLEALEAVEKETHREERKRARAALLFVLYLLCGVFLTCGVLLLAGSRWSEYSPAAHLILGSLPLVPAAAFGFWTLWKNKKQTVTECAAVSCALSVLLCVYTVSAECSIPGTLWDAVKLYAVCFFVPLICVFSGTFLALIETALLIFLLLDVQNPVAWQLPLAFLLLWLIGRIIVRPASAPARWGQIAFLALTAALSCRYYLEKETVNFVVYFAALISLLLSFGLLWQKRANFNFFRFCGECALIGFTAAASFSGFWNEKSAHFNLQFHGYTALAEIIVIVLLALLFCWAIRRKKDRFTAIFPLVLLPLVLLSKWGTPSVMAWLMAAYFIIFAVKTVVCAFRKQSVRGILYGGILLLGLGIAHFLKLENVPKRVAGVFFIACGLLFAGALWRIRAYLKTHSAGEGVQ